MKIYKLEIKLTELAIARFMDELKEAVGKCKKSKDYSGERLMKNVVSVFKSQINKQQKRI